MRTSLKLLIGGIVLASSLALVGGAAYIFGAIRAENLLYGRYASEKIARISPVLDDPAFAELTVDHGSGPEVTLVGIVKDDATLDRLRKELRFALGDEEARSLVRYVKVERRR